MASSNTGYVFIERISHTANYGSAQLPVSLLPAVGSYLGFFFLNLEAQTLVLPVRPGRELFITAQNYLPIMAAFPARLGTADGKWLNLCYQCEVTNLSQMPSADGLREALPNGSVKFDGLMQPGHRTVPFTVASGGILHGGEVYDRFEVAYRMPTDPADIVGAPASSTAKGRSTQGQRCYGPAHSFGVIRFLDRAEVARQLAPSGIVLDPDADYDWSAARFEEMGLRARDHKVSVVTI